MDKVEHLPIDYTDKCDKYVNAMNKALPIACMHTSCLNYILYKKSLEIIHCCTNGYHNICGLTKS